MALVAVVALGACKTVPEYERGKKFVHYALRANVGSLDPVRASSTYDSTSQSQVYEGLVSYAYLKRPYELEPLLAAAMPEVSADGLVYTFTLRDDVRFHDDPCFPGGTGRPMVAQDVVWSLMRLADKSLAPRGWWLFQGRVVGFDAFQERMNARKPGQPFDWDAPIEGMRAIGPHTLRFELTRPFPQFLFVLAMNYAAVLPRECAEYYGAEFGARAVGTGPFRLAEFVRDVRLVFTRNPSYRDVYYPSEADPELAARGLLEPAGAKLPLADGLVFHIYQSDEPMWLKFRVGDLDLAQVPPDYLQGVFDGELELRPRFVEEGMRNYNLPLLDYIYIGFNMEDPIVGQGERAKYVRQAVSLAIDIEELDAAFYNSTTVLYDGPIPPGLDGYQPGVTSSYRGPDLDRARELLAQAGYPGGKGLPELNLYTSKSSNSGEQMEMVARQLRRVGIRLVVQRDSFAELQTKLKRAKAQMFSLAWGADYPDAENFLQLFYGPNRSPGSNNFNYANPEYDALYEQSSVMFPSPERTAIYERMREIVIEDVPATKTHARTRFYVWNERLRNIMPAEVFNDWFKYLDVDAR